MPKDDKKPKDNVFPSLIVFTVFFAFVIMFSIFSEGNISHSSLVTGNAILGTGQLNSNLALGMLVIISIYALITCTYLSYRHKI